MKIAVTGASGLIGSRIIELLNKDFIFIPLNNETMDITNQDQVELVLGNTDFDLLLHLGAYTNVDGAEAEKERAYLVNVTGTENIFREVVRLKKKLIYISTDFVFDGTNPPYSEKSLPNPVSYYGLTKYKGENIVKDQAMIVRVTYPYRNFYKLKRDFVAAIYANLQEKKELTMVMDSLITPTLVDDIALGLKYLINHFENEVFHLVGAGSLSPYAAAQTIAQTLSCDPNLIKPITYNEYFKNKAKRPKLAQTTSLYNDFHPMKTLQEGLKLVYDIPL